MTLDDQMQARIDSLRGIDREALVNRLFAMVEETPQYSQTLGQTNLHRLNSYTLAVLVAIFEDR